MESHQGRMTMRLVQSLIAVAVGCAMSACAPKTIYSWGHYEDLVYNTYATPGKADTTTQVAVLTEDIDKAQAAGKKVPPGVHAQLGFAYYQQGNPDAAMAQFKAEEQLYPESSRFIDGILKRMQQPSQTP